MLSNSDKDVRNSSLSAVGSIGRYNPALIDPHLPELLAFTYACDEDTRLAAIESLGRILNARGPGGLEALPQTEADIVATLVELAAAPTGDYRTRSAAIDALAKGRSASAAQALFALLDQLTGDLAPALHERVYGHLGRIDPDHLTEALPDLLPHLRQRLAELDAEKAAWRHDRARAEAAVRRDLAQGDAASEGLEPQQAGETPNHSPSPWPHDGLEYDLGFALARLQGATAPDRAIALLKHPLYRVRQGAIAGLTDVATGELLEQVIAAREHFLLHPRHPSPFPYDAFAAIDRMLKTLERRGTAADVLILGRLRDSRPPRPPTETDWVRERLVWTIDERCLRLPEADAPPTLCAERRKTVVRRFLEHFD